MMNTFKTVFLMTALTLLLLLIGNLLGGNTGMLIALIFSFAMNFGSYWFSDKIVLSMYRAREITERDAPGLFGMVERLAHKAGIPIPSVYVIDNPVPNAFATGRNPEHASLALTTGIMKALTNDELEAVVGHELAHIQNRDILTGTIAASIVGAITWIAHMAGFAMMFGGGDDEEGGGLGALAMLIIAPIAATFLQLAMSRSREFAADEDGSAISGKPQSLASALAKLQQYNSRYKFARANEGTSHLFIVSPLTSSSVSKLFSTHPPIEERIKRLQQLGR